MEGEVTVPTAAKRCRCCMTPGIAFKDLSLEYEWMGEKEVYADMLLESFDVTLERNTKAGWTICDACISRLRDSSNFKKQVLYSERCLLQGLFPSDEKTLSIVYKPKEPAEMKLESQSEGDDAEEFETHYLDEDLDLDEDVKEIKQEPIASTSEMSNDEDTPLSSLRPMKVKSKVAAKVKSKTIGKKAIKITVPPEKLTVKKLIQRQKLTTKPQLKPKPNVKILESSSSHKLIKLSTKPVSVIKKGADDGVSLLEKLERNSQPSKKHKDQMSKSNSAVVVENTTVCPFRWSGRKGFSCFYCESGFHDGHELRTHTVAQHAGEKIRPMIRALPREEMLKVDLTDVRCRLCSETLQSLENIKEHLKTAHRKKLYAGVYEGVLPFKLTVGQYSCQMCPGTFRAFHMLNQHMNKHFKNYVCETCGTGFISQARLTIHQNMHKMGSYKCSLCDEVFGSFSSRTNHLAKVHSNRDRFACPHCPERFVYYHQRQIHLIKAHDATHLQYSCKVCGKVFMRKWHLTQHLRKETCV